MHERKVIQSKSYTFLFFSVDTIFDIWEPVFIIQIMFHKNIPV